MNSKQKDSIGGEDHTGKSAKEVEGDEGCVVAIGGSYRIEPSGSETEVILTTKYYAYLQRHCIWRPLELFLAHRFHRTSSKGCAIQCPNWCLPGVG
ncbi:MAG TPA: hypothetical protein VIJ38_13795 [Acidobacteriaceae bacterium]